MSELAFIFRMISRGKWKFDEWNGRIVRSLLHLHFSYTNLILTFSLAFSKWWIYGSVSWRRWQTHCHSTLRLCGELIKHKCDACGGVECWCCQDKMDSVDPRETSHQQQQQKSERIFWIHQREVSKVFFSFQLGRIFVGVLEEAEEKILLIEYKKVKKNTSKLFGFTRRDQITSHSQIYSQVTASSFTYSHHHFRVYRCCLAALKPEAVEPNLTC